MGRYDAGRIDIPSGVSIDAGINFLDDLEDIDPLPVARQQRKAGPGYRQTAKMAGSCRRQVENKLDDLHLRREMEEYSFRLH